MMFGWITMIALIIFLLIYFNRHKFKAFENQGVPLDIVKKRLAAGRITSSKNVERKIKLEKDVD